MGEVAGVDEVVGMNEVVGGGGRVIVSARPVPGKDMLVKRVRDAIGDLVVDVLAVDVLMVVVVVVLSSFSKVCCCFSISFLSLSILDNGRFVEGDGIDGVSGVSSGSLGCRPRAFSVSGMSGLGRLSPRISISSGSNPLRRPHFGFFTFDAWSTSRISVVASLFRLSSSTSSGLSSISSSTTEATLGVLGIVTDTCSFPPGPHDMVGGPCGPLTRLRTNSSRKVSTCGGGVWVNEDVVASRKVTVGVGPGPCFTSSRLAASSSILPGSMKSPSCTIVAVE